MTIQFSGLPFAEIVLMFPAELKVALGEGIQAELPDTVKVPESAHVVHPFLTAVRTGWTREMLSDSGIVLFQQSNQVIVESSLALTGQLKLRVQRLKLISNRIHGLILTQQIPLVKSELGNSNCISLVRLYRMD